MKRVIPFLPWLGALLLIAIVMLYFESDLLWKVQQYCLFLDTPLFFRQQMVVSGGFLSYISCFFTQFFYHPWLGVTILCGWWLLLTWLTKRTFRIPDNWAVLALIPVALLLVANMCLGYWHYFMRLQGYFYAATIGTTSAVAMLWGLRVLPKTLWVRICGIILATIIGYPLIGAYALVAILLMAIWTWRLSDNRMNNAIITVVSLICLVATPLIYYRQVYYQTFIDDIWTTALPVFTAVESQPVFYTPYLLLGGFYLLMTVFYPRVATTKPLKPLYSWAVQGLLMVALILSVWHFWYKDQNFHHELAMQRAIDQADWEGALERNQEIAEPTPSIVMMRNIALSRLGRQLDEMYNYPQAKLRSNTTLPYNMTYHVFGQTIYYQYGLLNDCHRRCLEDGVELGWSVELLKYMARCSLLSGEKQAAQKILDLLRHTTFHGQWADEMQQLLDKPELRAQDREMAPITHMLHYNNALGSDGGDVEGYIMSQLAFQTSDDPFFQEQALLATLCLGDQAKFWHHFFQYIRLHPKGSMPRIFQEAAYLFGKMENREGLERLPFDASVKNTYNAFMKESSKTRNQSIGTALVTLHPFFGNTYFYYYYYIRTNK